MYLAHFYYKSRSLPKGPSVQQDQFPFPPYPHPWPPSLKMQCKAWVLFMRLVVMMTIYQLMTIFRLSAWTLRFFSYCVAHSCCILTLHTLRAMSLPHWNSVWLMWHTSSDSSSDGWCSQQVGWLTHLLVSSTKKSSHCDRISAFSSESWNGVRITTLSMRPEHGCPRKKELARRRKRRQQDLQESCVPQIGLRLWQNGFALLNPTPMTISPPCKNRSHIIERGSSYIFCYILCMHDQLQNSFLLCLEFECLSNCCDCKWHFLFFTAIHSNMNGFLSCNATLDFQILCNSVDSIFFWLVSCWGQRVAIFPQGSQLQLDANQAYICLKLVILILKRYSRTTYTEG